MSHFIDCSDSEYYRQIIILELRKNIRCVVIPEENSCIVQVFPRNVAECERLIQEYCECFGTAMMDESNGEYLPIIFCSSVEASTFYNSI